MIRGQLTRKQKKTEEIFVIKKINKILEIRKTQSQKNRRKHNQ